MKSCFLLFTFLLTLYAQRSAAKDCTHYNLFIYEAEHAICNNDLQNALALYEKAFKEHNRVADLFNASCCAFYLRQNTKAFYFLKQYFGKGAVYYPTQEKFQEAFPNISLTVYDSVLALKKLFPVRVTYIQKIMDSLDTAENYYYNNKRDSAWYYERQQYSFFMSYLRKGNVFESDSSINAAIETSAGYTGLLFRFFQNSLIEPEDLDFLKEKVCEGALPPVQLASWMTVYAKDDALGIAGIIAYMPVENADSVIAAFKKNPTKALFYFAYDNYDVKTKNNIDKNRREAGLESFEYLKEKLIFVCKTNPVYRMQLPIITLEREE